MYMLSSSNVLKVTMMTELLLLPGHFLRLLICIASYKNVI